MARHSGLLTLAANTAAGLLDSAWAFLDGNTAGGWTWAREGTTDAVYGYKDFGSGGTAVRRVIWLAGNAAGSTPGLLSIDAAGAERVFVGAGRIAAGSFSWAGWTNAAPMGSGGIGRVHALTVAGAGTAVKLELFITDTELVVRLEGSTATTTRIARAGALCTALSSGRGGSATGDPDGLRTGAWVSGLTTAIAAGWLSGAESANVYAVHVGSASTSHGWLTVSGAVAEAQSRASTWPNSDSAFSGGTIRPVPASWHAFTGGLLLGYDTGYIGCCDYASATKVLSDGGIETAYALCRDSGATSTEAVMISAATVTP